MGIDIVDAGRRDPGSLDGGHHAPEGAVAVLGGGRDMVGVAGQAVADDLGVDPGVARQRVVETFQHDAARALPHDEAVAVAVVGPRGCLRAVIEARRQRSAGDEPRVGQAVDGGFRPARHHDLGVAELNQPGRVADRVRAGRAGRHHGVVRPFQPVHNRYVAAREVDQPARDEEGGQAARPLGLEQQGAVADAAEPPDAGADHDPRLDLLLVGFRLPARVRQRLGGGRDREDDELVDLALFLGFHPGGRVERSRRAVAAGDHAPDLAGKVGNIEPLDEPRTVPSVDQGLPRCLDITAERRHHPQSGYNNTPHRPHMFQPRFPAFPAPATPRPTGRRFRHARRPSDPAGSRAEGAHRAIRPSCSSPGSAPRRRPSRSFRRRRRGSPRRIPPRTP